MAAKTAEKAPSNAKEAQAPWKRVVAGSVAGLADVWSMHAFDRASLSLSLSLSLSCSLELV